MVTSLYDCCVSHRPLYEVYMIYATFRELALIPSSSNLISL